MASAPGTIRFGEVSSTPPAPPAGYARLYVKTDNVLYLQDSSGFEVALGSASAITSLTGEGTATGPGAAVLTLSNAAVIGKVLTGFVSGPNSLVLATDSILQAIQKLQAQVSGTSGTAITALTGDVSATGPGSATATVNSVGGSSAANINTATIAANAATAANTASTIVKRDASGNFSANIITASLSGNATTATTSTNFSGSLSGDVSGTQTTTSVDLVGGETAADVAQSVNDTQAATSVNTASTIVKRDASGDFAANVITADLVGNVTGNVTGNVSGTAANVTGIVAIANGGTNSSTALNNNRIMRSSGGQIVEAAAITANKALASNASGIPVASTTTDTELGYVSGVTSSIQAQLNATAGSAITSLTGDVTATGPGAAAATVAKIQGTTVTGTTGSGNVVFSNAPTLTGLLSGSSASFSSTVTASNISGTNTGDVSVTDTNSIDLTLAGQNVSADLKISADAADSGFIKVTDSIHANGLHSEIGFDTPVQIGTSNFAGTGTKVAAHDHVHQLTDAVTTARLLTGYTVGANTPIAATDSILAAFGKTQGQINATTGAAITSLTGDVTATGPGAAAATIPVGTVTDAKGALAVKPAVTVVATTNQTLSGTPTIDGQATASGSLILLTAQSTGSQNGPWVAAAGAWSRPTWYPSGGTSQAFQFITTFVRLGTVYQGSVWRQTAAAPITIDTTATTWVVTPTSGNYKSQYVVGPQSGSSDVSVAFSNAFTGTLAWNPTASYTIKLPPTQGAAGTFPSNDGSGNLTWTNPNVNIDGGTANSVYTAAQFISGGTP